MRRFTVSSVSAAALFCAAAVLVTASSADARPRKRGYSVSAERQITVQRRSWLDSGNVVPVGSTNAYVQESTRYNRPELQKYQSGGLWRPDTPYYPESPRAGGFEF